MCAIFAIDWEVGRAYDTEDACTMQWYSQNLQNKIEEMREHYRKRKAIDMTTHGFNECRA